MQIGGTVFAEDFSASKDIRWVRSICCLRVLSSCAVDKGQTEILPTHACLIH